MAKKPAEPVAERTTAFTPAPVLKKLLKDSRELGNDVEKISEGYGLAVRAAVDKKHLHKKAYNTIRSLDRMTPEKLADFMEHFDYYFEASGLEERAKAAERLPMGDKVGGEKQEGEGDDGKSAKSGTRGEAGAPVH